MTDLEKTRNLFNEMGANLKQTDNVNRFNYINVTELSTFSANPIDGVDLEMGYSGFDTSIFFDINGKFLGMGGFE